MIGGEFDLSIGSMIGACGMIIALLGREFGWNVWPAMLVALVVRPRWSAPSTACSCCGPACPRSSSRLATLFILRGVTIGFTRQITGRTQVGGLERRADGYDLAQQIFASKISIGGGDFSIAIVWWLGVAARRDLAAAAHRVRQLDLRRRRQLRRPRATSACRSTGSRSLLFMGTAVAAWLVAMIQVWCTFTGADVAARDRQRVRGDHRRRRSAAGC